MSMTDPIRDMFTRIRNANMVNKQTVSFPFSKFKWQILEVMEEQQYVGEIIRKGRKNKKVIEVTLRYSPEGKRTIVDITPVSKQSRRVYWGASDMHSARNGFGTYIVSTSKGVMSSESARKQKIGGEVICEIW